MSLYRTRAFPGTSDCGSARGRRAERLRREVGAEGVEAQAEVEREALDRPLVLRVDAELAPLRCSCRTASSAP